jgi:hypothetical protein
VAEGGECSHRAPELEDERLAPQLAQAGAVALDGIEPSRRLQAERRGRGLLHPGAAGDRRAAVKVGEAGERAGQAVELALNRLQRGAEL